MDMIPISIQITIHNSNTFIIKIFNPSFRNVSFDFPSKEFFEIQISVINNSITHTCIIIHGYMVIEIQD